MIAPLQIHLQERVLFCDTDAGGVVSNVHYLRFVEKGRTELLGQAGMTPAAMVETGVYAVVRRAEVDYLVPAKIDEVLDISARFVSVRGASAVVEILLRGASDGVPRVKALQTLACLNVQTGKPQRLPASWKGLVSEGDPPK